MLSSKAQALRRSTIASAARANGTTAPQVYVQAPTQTAAGPAAVQPMFNDSLVTAAIGGVAAAAGFLMASARKPSAQAPATTPELTVASSLVRLAGQLEERLDHVQAALTPAPIEVAPAEVPALPAPMPSEEEIRGLFGVWNAALATLDPHLVTELYAPDAVLLPTVSNQVRTSRSEILDYFNLFLTKKPQGVIEESQVSIMGPELAAHYGIYTFTLTNADGSTKQVSARFSYTYRKEGDRWLITAHHSSALPEVLDDEIRGLFTVWNNALATLDSSTVAACYAPDAVLLPTVSNVVRTTPEAIKDYFDLFLTKKPQGVINESHVRVMGYNLAAHYGIYTFTLTMEDGSTKQVAARFSYTYRRDNGRWLITEHHSSALPEVPPSADDELPSSAEVASLFSKWNAALATLDPEAVADCYATDAVLLPTVSNQVRTRRAAIVDYFKMFLTKKPHGVINESRVQVFKPDLAAHYGTYTFSLTDPKDGVVERVCARFSYTYRKENGKWLIVEHHSSAMPEVAPPVMPSKEEVTGLFNKWNAALATLNPETVADLYAPDATLLPTVSNKVRTNRAEILDYFKLFLTKKPQGVINESHVNILSPTLAAHYGIYTFTLTMEDGSTTQVGARFSYTYRKRGNRWLIVEHHSSVLPETLALATSAPVKGLPTKEEIAALVGDWNAALASLDPQAVADLYAPDATLLPTVSNKVRTSRAEIVDYYSLFLTRKPQCAASKSVVTVFSPSLAAHYGIYTFLLTLPDGRTRTVGARFSFTYRKEGDRWLILEHHSSALPEMPPPALPEEDEIFSLFGKWNSALATLDSAKVADLYAPDAVLLPTVSNKVRTSRAAIVDYFNLFLTKKPQGVINESHIARLAPNLAQHNGIYTFTLNNADGSQVAVSARFSYTYRKEGGRWLITQHHSSALPEPVSAPVAPSQGVREPAMAGSS